MQRIAFSLGQQNQIMQNPNNDIFLKLNFFLDMKMSNCHESIQESMTGDSGVLTW